MLPRTSPVERGAAREKHGQGSSATEETKADHTAGEGSARIVVLGRILAPYGVNGWIKARAFTTSLDSLMAYRSWWLAANDSGWREFAVLEARQHADSVLALLDGLSRREDAAAWRGASIGVPRSALPTPAGDEVYLVDLIGLTVVNRSGETLGRVAGLMETGAHAVLRVEDAARSVRLIPLVSAYVDAIEMTAGRILVDWHADY